MHQDAILKRADQLLANIAAAGMKNSDQVSEAFEKNVAAELAGASVSTATSGPKFRNDSLHADWQHVDRGTISTYLAFVDGLLQKHSS